MKRGHPSAIHQVELTPKRSVRRRGLGRRWYQRRPPSPVASISSSRSGPAWSWCSMIPASLAWAGGVLGVRDMSVLLVGTGGALPEGERVRPGVWLEEGDLQRSVVDRVVLAHELVHAVVAKHAVAVR